MPNRTGRRYRGCAALLLGVCLLLAGGLAGGLPASAVELPRIGPGEGVLPPATLVGRAHPRLEREAEPQRAGSSGHAAHREAAGGGAGGGADRVRSRVTPARRFLPPRQPAPRAADPSPDPASPSA